MSEPVTVVQETEDGLYQSKWIFSWVEHHVVLQRYQKSRREGDRWVVTHFWDASDKGGYGNWTWLKEKDVPWDEDLLAEVALAIVSKLTVGRPSDFRKRRR